MVGFPDEGPVTSCLSFYKENQQLYCHHTGIATSRLVHSISCHSYQSRVTNSKMGEHAFLEEKGPTPKP